MKLQCELCREIVPADFAIGDRGIDVHCPACGGDYAVAATRGNAVELAVARAAEQLARVARMAEATLLSSATRRPVGQAKPFRGTLALLAGLVLLIAIGAVYATISARQRADEPAYERPRRPPAGATPPRPASRPAPQPASTTGAEAGTAAPAPTPAPRR